MTCTYTYELPDGAERTVEFDYSISPGTAGTYWEPGDPPECEISEIRDENGNVTEVPDDMYEKLVEKAFEDDAARQDQADYDYEPRYEPEEEPEL